MKGEWTKNVRVEFETTIGMTDCYVSADCVVNGWWDEGRMWGDNAYPPEGGWEITDMQGQVEFYDHDGGITRIEEFEGGYSRQIDGEIEDAVANELERVFS
jgi:hypothetical protein